MLQQCMEYIHNYFFKPHGEGRYAGTYTIVDDNLSLPFLKDGQRFLIAGSDLNFGVYTYHADGIKNDDDTEAAGLKPETFAGTICALAVPPAVIALAGEISEWVENNGASVDSPYTSESVIGVYSYNKSSGGSGAGGAISWQDTQAGKQLEQWRKVSF